MRLPAPLVLLVAAGLLVLAAAPSANAAIAYAPCAAGSPLQCGSLELPLDRSGAVPGSVRLAAVRRVAPSNPTKTAVLGLAGGPGQAALPLISDFAQLMAPGLATRDLLMFDQRGTGASSFLRCSLNASSLTAGGQRCASEIGARRQQYTTAASVEDIEALRAESGYEQLVIYGVSYGTKVALDYAARHPTRVAGLILDSVVLPPGPDPLQRSTFTAMRRVLAELCAGGECAGISGNPTADLASRVQRLARKPLRGLLTTPGGAHQRVSIGRSNLLDVMLTGDENPTLRAELPGALTSARKGDSAPLIRLVARSAGIIGFQTSQTDFSDAVFAATLCEEGNFPWNRASSLTGRSQQINAAREGRRRGRVQPVRQRDGADDRDDLAVRRLAVDDRRPRARGPASERPDARHRRRRRHPHAARGRGGDQGAHPGRAGARGAAHRPLDAGERPDRRSSARRAPCASTSPARPSRRARRATTRSRPRRSRRRSSAA